MEHEVEPGAISGFRRIIVNIMVFECLSDYGKE